MTLVHPQLFPYTKQLIFTAIIRRHWFNRVSHTRTSYSGSCSVYSLTHTICPLTQPSLCPLLYNKTRRQHCRPDWIVTMNRTDTNTCTSVVDLDIVPQNKRSGKMNQTLLQTFGSMPGIPFLNHPNIRYQPSSLVRCMRTPLILSVLLAMLEKLR